MTVHPAVIPVLRYADAPAAIAFLCNSFGFKEHSVYADPGDPGIIHHAELVRDGQMVMLSTASDSPFATMAPLLSVAEAGGGTQSIYVVLDDVDAHAETARAGGAVIFMEPTDQTYGGRSYSVRDPEGNVWTFGSYDPSATPLASTRT